VHKPSQFLIKLENFLDLWREKIKETREVFHIDHSQSITSIKIKQTADKEYFDFQLFLVKRIMILNHLCYDGKQLCVHFILN
jgi:hypothetical protein